MSGGGEQDNSEDTGRRPPSEELVDFKIHLKIPIHLLYYFLGFCKGSKIDPDSMLHAAIMDAMGALYAEYEGEAEFDVS